MRLLDPAAVAAYRATLPDRLSKWLPQLIAAEFCYAIEVPLIAAVLDRETRGGDAPGLVPKGPAGRGDSGHGHGLMQIDDRTHSGFLHARFWDGVPLWSEPTFNILTGARLLRANLNATKGDLPLAIAAYNCGLKKARRFLETHAAAINNETARLKVLDSATANGNYVTHVLRMRHEYTPKEAANV